MGIQVVPEYLQETQRSENWFGHRIGKFTGSGMHKLMAEGRGDAWGNTARDYVFAKLYERVSNSRIVTPETFQMAKGKEIEEDAMRIFGERTRFYVKPCEYINSKEVEYIGASPDGLVYDNRDKLCGVWETKCRLDEQMLKNAFDRVNPKHPSFWQLQTEMYVAEVDKAYFTHYSDERECPFDLQIQIVDRNDEAIARMLARAKFADRIIKEAIESVGGINDRRISYITLTERMIAMKEYVYEHLSEKTKKKDESKGKED